MALSSMPWQAITALIALVSLLVFLPLVWGPASLPMRGASLLLTLLTPLLVLGGMVAWFFIYYAIYLDHYHLQNELGGFLVTVVPAVTTLGASILGIVDVLRRRAWGWLAPVALLPFAGTLAYGFVGRRKGPDGQANTTGGALQLAAAALALLSVLMAVIIVVAGLDLREDSTPELFALLGSAVAAVAGLAGGLALLRDRPTRAAVLLLITAVLAAQLVAGTSFPIQDRAEPGWAPSVVLRAFGIPGSESTGLWVTLGLIAFVDAVALASTPPVAQRQRQ